MIRFLICAKLDRQRYIFKAKHFNAANMLNKDETNRASLLSEVIFGYFIK